MANIIELNSSIDSLTNNVHKSNTLDVSKSYLPDSEIAINIIMSKNQTMTREEAQLMVGTYRDSTADDEESDQDLRNNADDKKNPSDKSSRTNRSKKIKYRKSDYQPQYPLPKNNSIVNDEVKKTKHDVRYSSMMIVKYSIDLGKEVVNVTTMMVQSIAGVTIMSSAPPWNIPGAITVLTAVVNVIITVVNKVSEVLKFLPALEKIDLVVQPGALSGILAIIKAAIDSINKLFNILKSADSFISTLIELLSSLSKNKLDTSRINKFLDKNDESGISDPPNGSEFNTLLDSAKAQAISINNNAKSSIGLTFSSDYRDSSLYDVEFPNGSTRYNVTQSELDEITANYNVIFKQLELSLSNIKNFSNFSSFDVSSVNPIQVSDSMMSSIKVNSDILTI